MLSYFAIASIAYSVKKSRIEKAGVTELNEKLQLAIITLQQYSQKVEELKYS
jgi:hypothetical protein